MLPPAHRYKEELSPKAHQRDSNTTRTTRESLLEATVLPTREAVQSPTQNQSEAPRWERELAVLPGPQSTDHREEEHHL